MNARALLCCAGSLLAARSGCGGPRSTDASIDAHRFDASDATLRDGARDVRSDAPRDARLPPPWVDGSLVLPIREYRWPPGQFGTCNGRAAVSPTATFNNTRGHWLDGTVYYSITGSMGRVVPDSGVVESFQHDPDLLMGVLAISGTRLVLGAAWVWSFNEAVIVFDQPVRGAVGRTLWQRQRQPTQSEGGFWGMSATPTLIRAAA
jgi:hypothetical protein